jgi:hypothetical protein
MWNNAMVYKDAQTSADMPKDLRSRTSGIGKKRKGLRPYGIRPPYPPDKEP